LIQDSKATTDEDKQRMKIKKSRLKLNQIKNRKGNATVRERVSIGNWQSAMFYA
jgi:hypothetical protein